LRNFHSLHAFLQGLSAAGFDHIVPQDLRLLIHTEANYAASREASNQGPCLPFLFSYRREYELRGSVALLEIFTAVAPYAVDPGARPVVKNLREHVLATDVEEVNSPGWTGLFSFFWTSLIPCFY